MNLMIRSFSVAPTPCQSSNIGRAHLLLNKPYDEKKESELRSRASSSIWIERSDDETCSIYCSSSGYFVLCFSSNVEALLKAFSASSIFPRCFFTSSSTLSGTIFLTGICFFTVSLFS